MKNHGKCKLLAWIILVLLLCSSTACGDFIQDFEKSNGKDNKDQEFQGNNITEVTPEWLENHIENEEGYEWHYRYCLIPIQPGALSEEQEKIRRSLSGKLSEYIIPHLTEDNAPLKGAMTVDESEITYGNIQYPILKGSGGNAIYTYSSVDYSAQEYLRQFPTEAFRSRSDGIFYGVYKTNTGFMYYVFFSYYWGEPFGYPIAIREIHSFSEFSSLKIGDSIALVEAIDGVASLYKNAALELIDFPGLVGMSKERITLQEFDDRGLERPNEPYNNELIAPKEDSRFQTMMCYEKENVFRSLHYLVDGLLEIRYEIDNAQDINIIGMELHEDYCISLPYDSEIRFDESILPIDLPR